MKSREITIRKLNKIAFAALHGYPKYYAVCKGDILEGYELVKDGRVQAGDYIFTGMSKGSSYWVQAVGAINAPVIGFNKICRPKKA